MKKMCVPELTSRDRRTIGLSGPPSCFQRLMFPMKISRSWSMVSWSTGIRRMDDDDDAVQGDDAPRAGVKPLALACCDLLFLDGPGRFGDVAGAVDEGGDPRPRTAARDGDVDVGMELVERLGPGLAEVDHRVRALDLERPFRPGRPFRRAGNAQECRGEGNGGEGLPWTFPSHRSSLILPPGNQARESAN